jgi:hypothetical protein
MGKPAGINCDPILNSGRSVNELIASPNTTAGYLGKKHRREAAKAKKELAEDSGDVTSTQREALYKIVHCVDLTGSSSLTGGTSSSVLQRHDVPSSRNIDDEIIQLLKESIASFGDPNLVKAAQQDELLELQVELRQHLKNKRVALQQRMKDENEVSEKRARTEFN